MNDFISIDPSTGETLEKHAPTPLARAREQAALALRAQREWAKSADEKARASALLRIASELRDRKPSLAATITQEMGKIAAEAEAEVEKCAWVCDHYAEHGASFLQREVIASFAKESYVRCEPLGIVLGIMPWNFPLWQVFRFAAPTLFAGNGIVLKHAANVSRCALAIQEVIDAAGLPQGLYATVLVSSSDVAELIADPSIAAVTLTGSTRAGRAVAEAAGRNLKPSVLELGGSDAYVILDDADVEAAAKACVAGRLLNCGQSCIAAKRFIVTAPVRKAFVEAFVEEMRQKKAGPPTDPDSAIGPMARSDLRDELLDQVERTVKAGGRAILGGEALPGPGYFFPPTVLDDVLPGMAAFDEEMFGPVAAIVHASDEDEAIELANRTSFGLGAGVFTRDLERGRAVAHRLEAGCCFVNSAVKSDPRLPFGGIKDSGYGRELGPLGIREFVNHKTVAICEPSG